MNARSIRVRLMGWCLGLALLASLGFTAFTCFEVRLCLRNNLETLLTERADRIGKFLLQHIDHTGESYVATEIEARYSPAEDFRFIRILRPDGTVMYESGAPKKQEFTPKEINLPKRVVSNSSTQQYDFPSGFEMLVVTQPYSVGEKTYVIQAGETAMRNRAVLRSLTRALVLFLPAFILVTVGGIYFLIGKTLQPVDRVTRAAKEISLQNLKLRLPETNSGDELERLTRAFNEMIGRLHEAFQHASRFSTDASHELRTPLAIIQGELEVIIQEAHESESRPKLYSLLEEVRHLNKIVSNLFAISRLEAGEALLEVTRLDFTALVRRTEEQMQALAEEKDISIEWNADEPVMLEGDATRLKQVVVNLLDNAIKYSPKRGVIELSVYEEDGKATLTVSNTGSRIADDAFPFIFDRFYRSGSHRAVRESGAGLGLSIVRSICSAHGGTVTATNESSGGCSFTVLLPSSPPRRASRID
jgi:heavy metal sensor kinase